MSTTALESWYDGAALASMTYADAATVLQHQDYVRASDLRGITYVDMVKILTELAGRGMHVLPSEDEWCIVHKANVGTWIADMNSESEFHDADAARRTQAAWSAYVEGLCEAGKKVA